MKRTQRKKQSKRSVSLKHSMLRRLNVTVLTQFRLH
nr:MAG TPA: hypothetical protein [Caudoviricetes sp.]